MLFLLTKCDDNINIVNEFIIEDAYSSYCQFTGINYHKLQLKIFIYHKSILISNIENINDFKSYNKINNYLIDYYLVCAIYHKEEIKLTIRNYNNVELNILLKYRYNQLDYNDIIININSKCPFSNNELSERSILPSYRNDLSIQY